MAVFRLHVNGIERRIESTPERPLLDALREDLGLTGAKYGCGEGQCRACTVLADGRAIVSCVTPVKAVSDKKITTIEGIGTPEKLHPVQQAFLDEGAFQCGYCTPGMILRTVALLEKTPSPTQEQTVEALNGNLCRCGGYPRIVAAVQLASRLTARKS